MYYKNYTEDAVLELERQRTSPYETSYNNQGELYCKECGSYSKLHKINSQYLCEECICNSLREVYAGIEGNMTVYSIDASEVLKNIISDFSDNELIYYVENLYEDV